MTGEWHTIRFERLLAEPVRNGIYKPKSFHGRGAKIVNMGELFAFPRLRAVPMKRVELSESEAERFDLVSGDLIFARRSLVAEGAGKCSVVIEVNEPTTFESSIIRARPDRNKAEPLYLYYFFNSASGLHCLDTIRRQVAVAGITGSDLARLEIPVPPLPEQQAIASLLGGLDDKIELNRQMNETLEATARLFFKDWFVDFGPTRAKAEGRARQDGARSGQPRKPLSVASGLPWPVAEAGAGAEGKPYLAPELWELFPDALDDGDRPLGWGVDAVGSIGNVVCGKTPSTAVSEYYGDCVPFITIPDMHGRVFLTGTSKRLSAAGAASQPRKMLPKNTICVSCIATPGLVAMTTEPSQTNQQINAVIPRDSGETFFWFWILRGLGDTIKQAGSGGSVLSNLRTGRFSALSVLSPPKEVRQVYHSVCAPLFQQILANDQESNALAQTRDLLLPKLMSGEIWLRDAEKFVEQVV